MPMSLPPHRLNQLTNLAVAHNVVHDDTCDRLWVAPCQADEALRVHSLEQYRHINLTASHAFLQHSLEFVVLCPRQHSLANLANYEPLVMRKSTHHAARVHDGSRLCFNHTTCMEGRDSVKNLWQTKPLHKRPENLGLNDHAGDLPRQVVEYVAEIAPVGNSVRQARYDAPRPLLRLFAYRATLIVRRIVGEQCALYPLQTSFDFGHHFVERFHDFRKVFCEDVAYPRKYGREQRPDQVEDAAGRITEHILQVLEAFQEPLGERRNDVACPCVCLRQRTSLCRRTANQVVGNQLR